MNPYHSQGPPPPSQGYYQQGGPPPRDYAPPGRDYPPPGRDYPPAGRDYPPSARDYPPPARDYPPPARDYPPSRDYPQQPRDYPPPPRDYGPPSRDYPPARDGPPPPRNFGPPPSQRDYPPRSDFTAQTPRDYPPPPRDYGPPPAGNFESRNYDRPPPPPRGRPNGGGFRGSDRPSSPDARAPRHERRDRERAAQTIEERVKQERPCRTLFVRNVSYEASSPSIRAMFEAFGEIKTFFDLIQNRGMAFVTFFDLRAAQRAREALHNSDVESRPIDVHFSLPRADEQTGRCDGEKNQGSMLVTIRHARHIDEQELGRVCSSFGEIRSIRPMRDQDQMLVEFFDSRATSRFYDACQDRPFGTGTFDLRYVWDDIDQAPTPLPPAGAPKAVGRGPGPRRSGEGPGYMGVKPRGPPPPVHDRGAGHDRRVSDDRGSSYGRDDRFRGPPPPGPPGGSDAGFVEQERLEQARKVQQLLTSLAGSPATAPPPPAQTSLQPHRPSGPPPPNFGPPPPRPTPGPGQFGQGPPPPVRPPFPPAVPPPGPPMPPNQAFPPFPPPRPQASAPVPPVVSPPTSTPQLPPNLMAMLQATGASNTTPQPPAASPYAPRSQDQQTTPVAAPAAPAPAAPSTGAMSQLLAMLAKK